MKFIGIDPAMRLNGLAVCVIDDKKVYFGRYRNLATWIMDSLTWQTDSAICVEDSSLQNMTFQRNANVRATTKISRNVGMNQAASKIIIDLLELNGHKVKGISPHYKGSKWTIDYCMSVIKAMKLEVHGNKKLSQDEIDAFQIALISKTYFENHGRAGYKKETPKVEPGIYGGNNEAKD